MSYNWQSGALQSINSKVFFRTDKWADSTTAQTYYQTKLQPCKSEL